MRRNRVICCVNKLKIDRIQECNQQLKPLYS